jgi:hypothetical protein
MSSARASVEQVVTSLQAELTTDKYGFLEYVKRGILVPEHPLLSLRSPFEERYGDCNFFAYFTETALHEAVDKEDISILLINIPYRTLSGGRKSIQHTVTRLKGGYLVGFSGYDRLIMGESGMIRESELGFPLRENIRQELSVAEFERRFSNIYPLKYFRKAGNQILVEAEPGGHDVIPVIENTLFPSQVDGVMRYVPNGVFFEVGVRGAKSSAGNPGVAFKLRVLQDLFDEEDGSMTGQGDLTEQFILPLRNVGLLRSFLRRNSEASLYDDITSGEQTPFASLPPEYEGNVEPLKELARKNGDILYYLLENTVVGLGAENIANKLKTMSKRDVEAFM